MKKLPRADVTNKSNVRYKVEGPMVAPGRGYAFSKKTGLNFPCSYALPQGTATMS